MAIGKELPNCGVLLLDNLMQPVENGKQGTRCTPSGCCSPLWLLLNAHPLAAALLDFRFLQHNCDLCVPGPLTLTSNSQFAVPCHLV